MDFMSDQLFDGRCIHILTIVDAFSRLVNDNWFRRQRQLKMPLSEPKHQGLALAFCGRGERGPALSRHGSS